MLWQLWNSDRMLEPLIFYILAATGCGLCLYLFWTIKVEIRALTLRRTEDSNRMSEFVSALQHMQTRVESFERDIHEIEQQTGMLVAPAAPKSGMNLSRRTQVLRMYRSGEQPAGIAASLGLPRSEVELLIKVHRLALDRM